MKKQETLREAFEKLTEAKDRFLYEFTKAIGVPKLVSWLEKHLSKWL